MWVSCVTATAAPSKANGIITIPPDANGVNIDNEGNMWASISDGTGFTQQFVDRLRVNLAEGLDPNRMTARSGGQYFAGELELVDQDNVAVQRSSKKPTFPPSSFWLWWPCNGAMTPRSAPASASNSTAVHRLVIFTWINAYKAAHDTFIMVRSQRHGR